MWLCGTVPHYTLRIEETKKFFYVVQYETFFNHEGNESPDTLTTLSKNNIDSLYLINGKKEFKYTGNYTYRNHPVTTPETIIYQKGNHFGFIQDTENFYDNIEFTFPVLTTYKNDLVGLYKITEPQYQAISPFEYYLAKCIRPNGKIVYIDEEGNEY